MFDAQFTRVANIQVTTFRGRGAVSFRLIRRWSIGGLCGRSLDDMRSHRLDFNLQPLELFGDDILVIRKITFQPLEGALFIVAADELLEFRHLGFAHALGQTRTHAHLQRLVHVFQELGLLFLGKLSQAELGQ